MWSTDPLLLREKFHIFEISPGYGLLCLSGVFLARWCLCFSYPSQCCPFCALLCRLCSSSFLVFVRGNYFIYSCIFVASVGGSEFRIFLRQHLEPSFSASSSFRVFKHDFPSVCNLLFFLKLCYPAFPLLLLVSSMGEKASSVTFL